MTESKLKKLFNIIKEKFKLLGKYIKNKIAEMKAKIKNIMRYGKDQGKEINSNIDKINKIIPKLEKINKEIEEAYFEISSLKNKLFIEKEWNREDGDRDEKIEKIENIIASKSKLYDKLSRENNKLWDEYQNLDLTNISMIGKKGNINNFEKYGRYKDDNIYKYGSYSKSKTESTIISKEELKFIIKECYIEIQMDNIDLIA